MTCDPSSHTVDVTCQTPLQFGQHWPPKPSSQSAPWDYRGVSSYSTAVVRAHHGFTYCAERNGTAKLTEDQKRVHRATRKDNAYLQVIVLTLVVALPCLGGTFTPALGAQVQSDTSQGFWHSGQQCDSVSVPQQPTQMLSGAVPGQEHYKVEDAR